MRTLPLFFALAGFSLAIGTGCAASRTSSPSSQNAVKPKEESKPQAADRESPVQLGYEELVLKSPLRHYAQEGPIPIVFLCTLTGRFKISPAGDTLFMQTYYVEKEPIPGFGVTILPAQDTVIKRTAAGDFTIPFKDARIIVQGTGSQRKVILRYKDPQGASRTVPLALAEDNGYEYSFVHIKSDEIEPLEMTKVIEVER